MAKSFRSLVTPSVLRWARDSVRLSLDVAAKKAGVTASKVEQWEKEQAQPTVRQARLLAATYQQPFAAFYLDSPPSSRLRLPHDYRRLAGAVLEEASPTVLLDVATAWRQRDLTVELAQDAGLKMPLFAIQAHLEEDPEDVGVRLRNTLGITTETQSKWRDPGRGFRAWREAAEAVGILVFQTSEIPPGEIRAYSLYAEVFPVVVVNRKDPAAARSFSLLHELVHLMLRGEGLCDLRTDTRRPPEEQRIEVFCNASAAACLISQRALKGHRLTRSVAGATRWDDEAIEELARSFACSREALVRRLVTLGLATTQFYEEKRQQYQDEYASKLPLKGFLAPAQDAVSRLGRPLVRLVLDGLNAERLTTSDASDILGVRLKHLSELAHAVES